MEEQERKRKVGLFVLLAEIELALGYSLCLLNTEAQRLAAELKLISHFQERKEYGKIIDLLKKVDDISTEKIWKRILDSYEGDKTKGEEYDAKGLGVKMFEGNELARLIVLYADKTAQSNENFEKVFTFMQDLKGVDLLDQKTYDRLYLNITNDDEGQD